MPLLLVLIVVTIPLITMSQLSLVFCSILIASCKDQWSCIFWYNYQQSVLPKTNQFLYYCWLLFGDIFFEVLVSTVFQHTCDCLVFQTFICCYSLTNC